MASDNGLPRLGSTEAKKGAAKTKVVAIPDRGVTVVLQKPTVATILDLQATIDTDSEDAKEAFASSVELVSKMLVEPEMEKADLHEEVSGWSFDDWQTLQNAAMELAGLREEDRSAAEREFPKPRS